MAVPNMRGPLALAAMALLVAASGDGVNLKLIGHVHLNEATGQLVTTFTNTPELVKRVEPVKGSKSDYHCS